MRGGRGRLTVGVVAAVLERVGVVDVVFGYVRRRHTKPLRDLGHRWQMHRILAAHGGLGRPEVAVVHMSLEVPLGQIGALASWHNTTHVEGTSLTLLDALNRIRAAVQRETEHRR